MIQLGKPLVSIVLAQFYYFTNKVILRPEKEPFIS
jgi:hypothetical protein